jgi:hypothetical protein
MVTPLGNVIGHLTGSTQDCGAVAISLFGAAMDRENALMRR